MHLYFCHIKCAEMLWHQLVISIKLIVDDEQLQQLNLNIFPAISCCHLSKAAALTMKNCPRGSVSTYFWPK